MVLNSTFCYFGNNLLHIFQDFSKGEGPFLIDVKTKGISEKKKFEEGSSGTDISSYIRIISTLCSLE